MKKALYCMAITVAVFLSLSASAAQTPAPGEPFPALKLAVPAERAHRAYLGLSAGDFFEVPQVKARVLIVEIMSMYCPFCQKEAPVINELYRLIEDNPRLKGTVKLIGIGAGNSPYEMKVFREKYEVPFPLIPDRDFAVHAALGEVRTPYFIGVRVEKGVSTVFYSKAGGFDEAKPFLDEMLRLSGLQ